MADKYNITKTSRIERANLKVNGQYIKDLPIGSSSKYISVSNNGYDNLQDLLDNYLGNDTNYFGKDGKDGKTISQVLINLLQKKKDEEDSGRYIPKDDGKGYGSLTITDRLDGDVLFQVGTPETGGTDKETKIRAKLKVYSKIENDDVVFTVDEKGTLITSEDSEDLTKEASKNWGVPVKDIIENDGSITHQTSTLIHLNEKDLWIGAPEAIKQPYFNGTTNTNDTYIVSGMKRPEKLPTDVTTPIENCVVGSGDLKIAIPKLMTVIQDYGNFETIGYDYKGNQSSTEDFYTYENIIHSGNIDKYMLDESKLFTYLTVDPIYGFTNGSKSDINRLEARTYGINDSYEYLNNYYEKDSMRYSACIFTFQIPNKGYFLLDYNFHFRFIEPATQSGFAEVRLIRVRLKNGYSYDDLKRILNSAEYYGVNAFEEMKNKNIILEYVTEEAKTTVVSDKRSSGKYWGKWLKGTQIIKGNEKDIYVALISGYNRTLSDTEIHFISGTGTSPDYPGPTVTLTKIANLNE